MKKLRLSRKKKQAEEEVSQRITNETVAEHREQVLAGGRRFKYPVQYAKHRLVINTIIISLVALLTISIVVWWQLYPSQNTSTFFYKITRILPLPVASIDGYPVRYSDYLVGFRSQEHYLQSKEGVDLYSKENKPQLIYIKRQALSDAIADSYAAKLASELSIKVDTKEVDAAIKRQRQSRDGITSQEAYDAIVLDHFNWTPDEAREVTARKLLRQKVAYEIDSKAIKQRNQVTEALKSGSDFDKIAAAIAPVGDARVETGVTPLVPSNNQDGGLAEVASKLELNQVSPMFRSTTGDGYYVVKPIQKDRTRVSYVYIKVPLTEFQAKLDAIKNDKKLKEFITVPDSKSSN
ncbi:MAG: hypothetical protein QG549_699 [Patescibacteria group bacterium]|nr:hypothetical protein [Patescibacteria group bacterium]